MSDELITVDEVKANLEPKIPVAVTEHDDLIQDYIDGILDEAEKEIGIKLLAVTDEVVYMDGGANCLYLPHFNVSNVSIWQDSSKVFDDLDLLDSDYYTVYGERGKVKLDGGVAFLGGNRVIKIQYDGGYSSATIPKSLKRKLIKQICYEFKRRRDAGLSSVTSPDGTISKFIVNEWLPDVEDVLKKMKRFTL